MRAAVISALVAPLMAACSAAASASCAPSAPDDLKAAYATWQAAYRAHDLDGTMAIFSRDVVFQFQGAPDMDWQALRRSYESEFAAASGEEWVAEPGSIEVSGDLGVVFSQWRLVPHAAGAAKAHNNSVDTFKRDGTCRWRIVRSLNYPLK
ncbi:MAG: DUF4440 domain-containing protein [Alphaproteobacteria bacterium]|nr:DUF4440 domain-containing protein [Alphaproteobacteria bacterium]